MIGKGKVERKKKNGKVTNRNGWVGYSDYDNDDDDDDDVDDSECICSMMMMMIMMIVNASVR